MKIKSEHMMNLKPELLSINYGDRWTGFKESQENLLRNFREEGYTEDEIATFRLNRELDSRIGFRIAKNNLTNQRAAKKAGNLAGASHLSVPPQAQVAKIETLLSRLILEAKKNPDDVHAQHWVRKLRSHLVDTRNMMTDSTFSTTV